MSEEKCNKPAVAIMHWPGNSVPKCQDHLDGWYKVANAIGMPPPTITKPDNGELCSDVIRNPTP